MKESDTQCTFSPEGWYNRGKSQLCLRIAFLESSCGPSRMGSVVGLITRNGAH